MSIGSRIKARREQKGLTQEQLAERLGVSKGAIGNYESGKTYPKIENLIQLLDILETDANDLFQDDMKTTKRQLSGEERTMLDKYRRLDVYGVEAVSGILDVEYRRCCPAQKRQNLITVKLAQSRASAGAGYDLDNEDNWTTVTVQDCREAREADFAVTVEGDSMLPLYKDGDVVFVVVRTEIPHGEIGLFRKWGKGYIKKCGTDRLISLNPAYDDIYPEDEDGIICVGSVLGTACVVE